MKRRYAELLTHIRYGFDATSSQAANMLSETDAQQLAFAVLQQHTLVTLNVSDFVHLHEKYLADAKSIGGAFLH